MPPATRVAGSVIAADIGPQNRSIHSAIPSILLFQREGEIEIDTARGRGVENASDRLKVAYLKFVQSKHTGVRLTD